MKKQIHMVDGMPVEVPELDAVGEEERARLNALALEEYKNYGTLVSEKLQEANAEFLEKAKGHVKEEEGSS